jgi:hypothetical protein
MLRGKALVNVRYRWAQANALTPFTRVVRQGVTENFPKRTLFITALPGVPELL